MKASILSKKSHSLRDSLNGGFTVLVNKNILKYSAFPG
jgi:hypothetical protein